MLAKSQEKEIYCLIGGAVCVVGEKDDLQRSVIPGMLLKCALQPSLSPGGCHCKVRVTILIVYNVTKKL